MSGSNLKEAGQNGGLKTKRGMRASEKDETEPPAKKPVPFFSTNYVDQVTKLCPLFRGGTHNFFAKIL
jgi:hypothetical protein